MVRRLIFLMFFLGTACQSGIIPCPRIKTARAKKTIIHKHFLESASSMSAKAGAEEHDAGTAKTHAKNSKGAEIKVIENVTAEEWDCPRPGRRKYMPKTVKENIRKNLQKINSGDKNETDSLSTAPPTQDTIRR